MPLQKYKDDGLLFNSNFLEQTSDGSMWGYRGELVLIKGEIADDKGHAKPPLDVVRGVVLLADDKLNMVIGALDKLESVSKFMEMYAQDFAADVRIVLFIVNIKDAMQVEIDGYNIVFIPLAQGVAWNEIIDELALEKSDFKGQSKSDKILTVYNELQSYAPKYKQITLDEALASTEDIVREAWGAV